MSNATPKVSVIIGTYNRADSLNVAIQSVLKQEHVVFELIIVDDASTDGTADLLKGFEYDRRVRVLRRSENSGLPAVARNDGCRLAKGRYIAFLDSDDYWLPGKLRKQTDFMDANPACGLCHTFCQIEEPDGRHLFVRRQSDMPQDGDLYGELLRGCFITTSSVMVRRKVFNGVGGFSEHKELAVGEDRRFFLDVARTLDIGFIPETLVVYRKHSENICASGDESLHDLLLISSQKQLCSDPAYFRDSSDRMIALGALIDSCVCGAYSARKRRDFLAASRMSLVGLKESVMTFDLLKQLVLSWLRVE